MKATQSATDGMFEFIKDASGDCCREIQSNDEVGMVLVRKAGKNYVGFADTDQVFQFTDFWSEIDAGLDGDQYYNVVFACPGFDIMVPIEGYLDHLGHSSKARATESDRSKISKEKSADELGDILNSQNDVDFSFGNGFKLQRNEEFPELTLSGENLYQFYTVKGWMNLEPYGIKLFLDNYNLFIRY